MTINQPPLKNKALNQLSQEIYDVKALQDLMKNGYVKDTSLINTY
jgi:hypothetical protein